MGDVCYYQNQYYVEASGDGIAGLSDRIQYIYLPYQGNVDIIARVNWIKNFSTEEAGVMLRETLTPGSPQVSMIVNGQRLGKLYSRATAGGATATNATKPARRRLNSWVRLSRSGNNVIAYYSRNGTIWDYVGIAQFSTSGGYYVGLVTTTSNTGKSCDYILDNVSVDGVPYRLANMPASLSVEAFPNPFGTRLSLDIATLEANQASLIMVNQLGQVVLRESLSLPGGEYSHSLNTAQLSAGVYFLRVQVGEEMTTVKVVKE